MSKQALLIFTKNPEEGKVKTRLAATIGNKAALAVFLQLQGHTVLVTESLNIDKFVFYANYIKEEDAWKNEYFKKEVQEGGNLGERMRNAFALIFEKRYEGAVIIGTDCPGINANIIRKAFAYLHSHDVVIGPAEDGGYYLLGMKKLYNGLFEEIQWSTSSVLNNTIQKCVGSHLQYVMLPVLRDVDEEKDLVALNW